MAIAPKGTSAGSQGVFCVNPDCADRGVKDKGNVKVPSHQERRFRCLCCGKTFAATKAPPGIACIRIRRCFCA